MRKLLAGVFALAILGLSEAPARAQSGTTTAVANNTCPSSAVVNVGNGRPEIETQYGFKCVLVGGGVAPAPLGVTTTNDAGTVTTGSTFQSVIASSATRSDCLVQNPTTATEPLFVFVGANGSATTAHSITLAPGAAFSCANGGVVRTDNISVTATTSAHAFYADNE